MMGMHLIWWIFWILLIVILAGLLLRRRSFGGPIEPRSTPLEILERRYAAGDISTEEFEERKATLARSPK